MKQSEHNPWKSTNKHVPQKQHENHPSKHVVLSSAGDIVRLYRNHTQQYGLTLLREGEKRHGVSDRLKTCHTQ